MIFATQFLWEVALQKLTNGQPGLIFQSRWLTSVNNLLRLYVGMLAPKIQQLKYNRIGPIRSSLVLYTNILIINQNIEERNNVVQKPPAVYNVT